MKNQYSTPDGCYALVDNTQPGTATVAWLFVPAPIRGRGLGTALLSQVLRDADSEDCTLLLIPQPGMNGLTYGQLVQWYHRHGFNWETHNTMLRYPTGGQPCSGN